MAARLTIGVLGPLTVAVDGRPVAVTAARLRTLLVALAMSAGTQVSVDSLAEAVWGDALPDNVRRSVQTYVARLRGVIGADAIVTAPTGYVLRAEPDDVDALRFVRLLDAAAEDPTAEPELLAQALGMWRGEPFADISSERLTEAQGGRLVERYLRAVERRIDLDLAAGRGDGLAAELRRLTAEHPLREPLWERLLTVLDRFGQRAEALRQYEIVRVRIADELGVDPGPELQRVYADLLAEREPEPADPVPWVVPRQLPADAEGFTGRDAELAALDALIPDGDAARSGALAVVAGTAGVGKTALVLHWAHRVAERFPDGQLYVNLRGFDPGGSPASVAETVRGFLDALGVPRQRIPTGVTAQVGLYRSLLADRRMLVVLDNASDPEQVRPLLPGAAGCLTLVTSRNQLTGLVAAVGARPVTVDLLAEDDARALLTRRLGAARVAAEPAAVTEIVARCARLPLALAIVAGRAAIQRHFPLDAFARQLREAQGGLAALTAGDVATDVRAVFSWSYRTLTPAAARLFRLLGAHPGPDIGAAAVASLAGVPPREAEALLAELCRVHLVTEHVPGRYTFHDLLRAYAADVAQAEESNRGRQAALQRMLDHYLHTASSADRLLFPHRYQITVAQPVLGVTPQHIADHEAALAWFTAERPVLLAAVALAAEAGLDTHTWQLAWLLDSFLTQRGHVDDWATTQRAALAAAVRLTDEVAQGLTHCTLARAYGQLSDHDAAYRHYAEALRLFEKIGDDARIGQAYAHRGLGGVRGAQQRHAEALRHAEQAVALFEAVGHAQGRASSLNAVGWYHGLLGDHERSLEYCEQALALLEQLGDRNVQIDTWRSLGSAHHHLGHHRPALTSYQRALAIARELGDRRREAGSLLSLGDVHHSVGDLRSAAASWHRALRIFDELGHPDAATARTKLAAITQPTLSAS